MTIAECPGCKHDRSVHGTEGTCTRLVEMITAGGETALTICGRCGWVPMIFDNGSRGWRHESARDTAVVDVESETLEAALEEVARLMGYR